VPAVARLLPKPGAWMQTLRRVLAFPMFATVAWLVWVLGQQSGIDGAGALLALLVCLAAVVWAFTLRGRTRAVVATIAGCAQFPRVFVRLSHKPLPRRFVERCQGLACQRGLNAERDSAATIAAHFPSCGGRAAIALR
jgi:thiol:disulfide interchange protein